LRFFLNIRRRERWEIVTTQAGATKTQNVDAMNRSVEGRRECRASTRKSHRSRVFNPRFANAGNSFFASVRSPAFSTSGSSSPLVENILPGLPDQEPGLSEQDHLAEAVEANVRCSVHQLLETPEAQNAAKLGGKLWEESSRSVRAAFIVKQSE
jgi:hypothetical protein